MVLSLHTFVGVLLTFTLSLGGTSTRDFPTASAAFRVLFGVEAILSVIRSQLED